MNLRIKNIAFRKDKEALQGLPEGLLLITTINAHSYNVAQEDAEFASALLGSDVLIQDGAAIVKAVKWLRGEKIERIAGWDLFVWEMERLQQAVSDKQKVAKAFFLGSTEAVLAKIKARAAVEYPNVEVYTYSPPYKPEFSDEDNAAMLELINSIKPDVLFVGMTAPKQEKWAYKLVHSKQFAVSSNIDKDSKVKTEEVCSGQFAVYSEEKMECKLNMHVCCIGAVFDFYAGTVERAPLWWQRNSLEWLFRLIKEPRRMWRRYLVGNVKFAGYLMRELLG